MGKLYNREAIIGGSHSMKKLKYLFSFLAILTLFIVLLRDSFDNLELKAMNETMSNVTWDQYAKVSIDNKSYTALGNDGAFLADQNRKKLTTAQHYLLFLMEMFQLLITLIMQAKRISHQY